jgi:hypothetical protein
MKGTSMSEHGATDDPETTKASCPRASVLMLFRDLRILRVLPPNRRYDGVTACNEYSGGRHAG